MKIKMIDNVTPEAYDLPGPPSWVETVQWRKGEIYDLPGYLAHWFMDNGDAYNAESFDEEDAA